MATAMMAAPAVRVGRRPTRSMMSISSTVQPILTVLSMPPASSAMRVPRPSFLKRVGR